MLDSGQYSVAIADRARCLLVRLRDATETSLPRRIAELIRDKDLAYSLVDLQAWAAKGDAAAFIALAHAFFYGGLGVDKNFTEAKRWLERIDKANDHEGWASHRLGIIFYKGLTGPQDRRAAYKFFRRATLRGNAKSRLALAVMQKQGTGTLKKLKSSRANFYRCSRSAEFNKIFRVYLAIESWLAK